MANTIISVKPEYGVNYKEGFIGFTFDDSSFLSMGISWFTRWEKGVNPDVPNISISHCFVVTGPDSCVEAWVPYVRKSKLSDYFNNPHLHVSFRKPKSMSDEMGKSIAEAATSQIGKSYDVLLIIGLLLTNTFVGKFLEKITNGWSKKLLTNLFNKRKAYICSELVGYAMSTQPQYKGQGILNGSLSSTDPQSLFEDRVIFEPWSEQIKGEKS